MGSRARKRAAEAEKPPPSRSQRRDAAARERLEALADGERPRAVTVGALVAAALALGETVALLTSSGLRGGRPAALSVVTIVVLLAAAAGMWRVRYWAVLGMQVLLALALVSSALALVTASNLAALVLVFGIIVPAGALFWFLVKAMARIQMPERRPRRG